jgi:hypothetical protein
MEATNVVARGNAGKYPALTSPKRLMPPVPPAPIGIILSAFIVEIVLKKGWVFYDPKA